jgi:ERCC4-type nuclease
MRLNNRIYIGHMIYIDYRERSLLEECKTLMSDYPEIKIESTNLKIGDMMIDKVIIERKTWSDLEASIKDKRYTEQSFRLQETLKEGFRVYYWLEGDLNTYQGTLPKDTLRKAMFGLMEKGFFVVQTKDCKESALFLLEFVEKWIKPSKSSESMTYEESCITKQKQKNITRDNISLFMLSQIPSISMKTAQIILSKYGHIREVFRKLLENPNEFQEFSYDKDGKPKKLNKNIVQNLKEYLGEDIHINQVSASAIASVMPCV